MNIENWPCMQEWYWLPCEHWSLRYPHSAHLQLYYDLAFTASLLGRHWIITSLERTIRLQWNIWYARWSCLIPSYSYTQGVRLFFCGASAGVLSLESYIMQHAVHRLIDSVQLAFLVHALYFYAVSNFGNLEALLRPSWYLLVQMTIRNVKSDIVILCAGASLYGTTSFLHVFDFTLKLASRAPYQLR